MREINNEDEEIKSKDIWIENNKIKIFISYNDETKEIEIEENNNIDDLKKLIEEKFKVKKEYQILKNQNEDFFFEKTIKENNIKDEETLYLFNIEEVNNDKNNHLCGNFLFF
jgi:hypothetical protein